MKKYLLALILCLCCPLAVFAAHEKYVDSGYDFRAVDSVFYIPPVISAQVSEETEDHLSELYYEAFMRLNSVIILTPASVIPIIESEQKMSFNDLRALDRAAAYTMVTQEAMRRADLIIYANVFAYTPGTSSLADLQFRFPEDTSAIAYGPYGSYEASLEGLQTPVIAQEEAQNLLVGIRFDVVSTANTAQPVYSYFVTHPQATPPAASVTAESEYEKTLQDFFTELNFAISGSQEKEQLYFHIRRRR